MRAALVPQRRIPTSFPLATVLALSLALHLYIGARLVPALPSPAAAAVLALFLLASAVLVPLGLLARRMLRLPQPAADRLTWAGMLCMGLFSSLLVLTFLRDLLLLGFDLAGVATNPVGMETAVAVPLAALALTALGFVNARRTARVVRVEVPLAGLPGALEGLRIVQISDIHVGPTIKQEYLQAIVDRVNALAPDVVAITGDLVDGSVAELASHVAPLAALRARHGVFFVTGNHEYYSGVHGWVEELRRLGIRVLHNEHVVLREGEAALVLAGVPDTPPWTTLSEEADRISFYAGPAEIELYRTETEYYGINLLTDAPSLWVVLRATDGEPPYRVFKVTADPGEGEGLTEAGNDIVEMVAMPPAIQEQVAAFVAEHHVDRTFSKRVRDRADPQAMSRGGDVE